MAKKIAFFCLLSHLLVLVTAYYLPYTGFLSLIEHFYYVSLRKAMLQNSNFSNSHVWRDNCWLRGFVLATLHKKVISQREKYMPHFLGHQRSLFWQRICSAELMGKTLITSLELLAPHLQQLSGAHNSEPDHRTRQKRQRAARYYV